MTPDATEYDYLPAQPATTDDADELARGTWPTTLNVEADVGTIRLEYLSGSVSRDGLVRATYRDPFTRPVLVASYDGRLVAELPLD